MARRGERISARARGSSDISQRITFRGLENLPACAAKSFPVFAGALADGMVAISICFRPSRRRIVRASVLLLRGADCARAVAISQNHAEIAIKTILLILLLSEI